MPTRWTMPTTNVATAENTVPPTKRAIAPTPRPAVPEGSAPVSGPAYSAARVRTAPPAAASGTTNPLPNPATAPSTMNATIARSTIPEVYGATERALGAGQVLHDGRELLGVRSAQAEIGDPGIAPHAHDVLADLVERSDAPIDRRSEHGRIDLRLIGELGDRFLAIVGERGVPDAGPLDLP